MHDIRVSIPRRATIATETFGDASLEGAAEPRQLAGKLESALQQRFKFAYAFLIEWLTTDLARR
jgi:hypothetical protein